METETDSNGRVELVDGWRASLSNPGTFLVPDWTDILNLKVGDHVKVCARIPKEGKDDVIYGGERFWMKVMRLPKTMQITSNIRAKVCQGDMLYAEQHGYNHGDEVTIRPFHILDIKRRSGKPDRITKSKKKAPSGPVPNRIEQFAHCARCLKEMPVGTSPRNWAQLEVGTTADGFIQVWCKRHELNVGMFKLAEGGGPNVACIHEKENKA